MSRKNMERGERRGVRPRMKMKEKAPGGYVIESVVPYRIIEGDRSSKRCNINIRVSNEYTGNSGSRVREDKVRSPWLLRYATTLEEYEAHSRGVDVGEYGKESLREEEKDLMIVNVLMWLQIGISLGYLTEDDERIWRNPLFKPPPLCIFNQEERTIENAEIRVEEERVAEGRREDMSGEK
jgi:hypothetical protein